MSIVYDSRINRMLLTSRASALIASSFLLAVRLSSVLFFFFSSRRRHTRSLCDWSSDVCSSDLAGLGEGGQDVVLDVREPAEYAHGHVPNSVNVPQAELASRLEEVPRHQKLHRSEERRVGKEGRSGRALQHEKKTEDRWLRGGGR